MVHASWLPHNGFRGAPGDLVQALQEIVGSEGLLIMPSMTYQNETSKQFISRHQPMDVRLSPSSMGLLSEVFRRMGGVHRSLSPTHPILAWGDRAQWFVADHEHVLVPFGKGSPFEKLLALDGKLLAFDASFSTLTFAHFLEDRIAGRLDFPLYEDQALRGTVIDASGRSLEIPVKVFSPLAGRLRNDTHLLATLENADIIERAKLGNSRLLLVGCRLMADCIDGLKNPGDSFFDPAPKMNSSWEKWLRASHPLLELPLDHPRQGTGTDAAEVCRWKLSDDLANKLRRLEQRQQTSQANLLLAVLGLFLHRFTGQDDLSVTTTVYSEDLAAGRGTNDLVGYCLLPIDFSASPTLPDLLSQLEDRLRQQEGAACLPCQELDKAINPEWQPNRSALFQVLFDAVTAAADSDNSEFPESLESVHRPHGLPRVPDLSLHIRFKPDRTEARVSYNRRLFYAATIERFIRHMECLIEAMAATPDLPMDRLAIMPPEEQSRLIAAMNETQRDYPGERGIHRLFEEQVKRTPEQTAVVCRDTRLSYAELNKRANRLAHRLINKGVAKGVGVVVFMERSVEAVVAILAILKTGGTYVPLDAGYPQERVSFILADADIPFVVTLEPWVAALPNNRAELVVIREDGDSNRSEDETDPPCVNEEADTALVLYTSGSTGNPKGVMVRHDSLVNLFHAYSEVYDYQIGAPSVCQMAFFAFAVFQADWVRALCSGGKLLICPREALLSPQRLYRLMCEERVDFAEFVPSLLRSLLGYLRQSKESLDFLRTLVVGSDRWYLKEYYETKQYCGENTHLIHVYGASETTFDSTWFDGTSADLSDDQLVPIGKPFPNIRVYVVDRYLKPVPHGFIGELFVAGAGIANGYVNLTELTREKFMPDPFFPMPPGRAFRTGDLVRLLPDFNIAFYGRQDHQIKIHGFRIELGEIEIALGEHPGIQACLVQPWEISPGEMRLVAYCVYEAIMGKPSREDLRSFLSGKLPDFMVPSHFVTLGELPLTPSGKVDRRALPTPLTEVADRHAPSEDAPPSETHGKILAIMRNALQAPEFGLKDNFFTHGGDSIGLITVIADLEKGFGITINTDDINLRNFETVVSLVKFVEKRRQG